MLDTEKLTQENDIYSELSLESILAEYADFDAGLAAEGSTSERSKQIVSDFVFEPTASLSPERLLIHAPLLSDIVSLFCS